MGSNTHAGDFLGQLPDDDESTVVKIKKDEDCSYPPKLISNKYIEFYADHDIDDASGLDIVFDGYKIKATITIPKDCILIVKDTSGISEIYHSECIDDIRIYRMRMKPEGEMSGDVIAHGYIVKLPDVVLKEV